MYVININRKILLKKKIIFHTRYRYLQLICLLMFISLTVAQFPHPAVIENAAQEELLPHHLKNPFYRTPRVRAALERHSWFGPGERPVLLDNKTYIFL